MFIVSMATLMRSYLAIKLFFLALFLLAFLVSLYLGKARVLICPRLVRFYLCTGLAGLAWAFVGVLDPANYRQGVLDALKLYVVWSAAFCVLFTLLRSMPSLRVLHAAMVMAGILIPIINLAALYGHLGGTSLIPESVQEELNMEVGYGRGYFQFSSNNIISMFLIAPYLLSLQFRADAGKSNSLSTKLALALSLIFVVVSGRRALWIVVALTPSVVLLLSRLTGGGLVKGRSILLASAIAVAVGLSTLFIVPEGTLDSMAASSVKEAFSPDDVRTMQESHLIAAFLKSPVLGAGFGAHAAGYIGSDEWQSGYELTYFQMLLNLGIVGIAFVGALFSLYFGLVVRVFRQFKDGSAIPFGLLIAFFSLVAGAYSNPYLGGFDSLFFVGLLPFLSTFQHGFEQPKLAAGVAL
jgi:O-antigen ligase